MATQVVVKKIAREIQRSRPEEQRQLLIQLPHLLKLNPDDFAALKLAEPSFEFWNNLEDIVYDNL